MDKKRGALLKYGLPSQIIEVAIAKGLAVTSIKANSIEILVAKFGLLEEDAKFLKQYVARKPIADAIVDSLLVNNNFTCCCCHGIKGHTYIIHHIEEYEKTKDNSYDNLAVLCPVCHDLAHGGRSLSLNIKKPTLRKAKKKWESFCRLGNVVKGASEPLFETWQTAVDECEDEPSTLLDLTIKKENGKVTGYFQLINLSRGNTFMAGEFSHPDGHFDVDAKLLHWEMQWGIRSSLKKESNIIMTYLNADKILWRDVDKVITDHPLMEFHKPKSSETWAVNFN
jgi:hypothetical protein